LEISYDFVVRFFGNKILLDKFYAELQDLEFGVGESPYDIINANQCPICRQSLAEKQFLMFKVYGTQKDVCVRLSKFSLDYIGCILKVNFCDMYGDLLGGYKMKEGKVFERWQGGFNDSQLSFN